MKETLEEQSRADLRSFFHDSPNENTINYRKMHFSNLGKMLFLYYYLLGKV